MKTLAVVRLAGRRLWVELDVIGDVQDILSMKIAVEVR